MTLSFMSFPVRENFPSYLILQMYPTTKGNTDVVDMKCQSHSDIPVTLAQALANRRQEVVYRKNCSQVFNCFVLSNSYC